MTGYRSKEDHDIAHEWMEKHKNADEIVFDTETNLVVKAVYYEPVFAYYDEAKRLAAAFFDGLVLEEDGA
jgi:hypothetical protein